MRKLVFSAFTKEDQEPNIAYLLLYMSLNNPEFKAGNREQRKSIEKVFDVLDTLKATDVKVEEGKNTIQLRAEGGTVFFEDAEFETLKRAWEQYSPALPASAVRDINKVDRLVDAAPTVKPEELTTK